MGEARKVAGVAIDQSRKQKEVILEAPRERRTINLATLTDSCHLKNCGVGTEVSKSKKAGSYSEVTL